MKQGSQGRGLLGYFGVIMVGIERSDSQDPDGKKKDLREITGGNTKFRRHGARGGISGGNLDRSEWYSGGRGAIGVRHNWCTASRS